MWAPVGRELGPGLGPTLAARRCGQVAVHPGAGRAPGAGVSRLRRQDARCDDVTAPCERFNVQAASPGKGWPAAVLVGLLGAVRARGASWGGRDEAPAHTVPRPPWNQTPLEWAHRPSGTGGLAASYCNVTSGKWNSA